MDIDFLETDHLGRPICGLCKNSGFVSTKKIGYKGHPFAFRCHCSIGQAKSPNVETWNGQSGFIKEE